MLRDIGKDFFEKEYRNLQKQYIKDLLGTIDNLKIEFAKIDQQNIQLPFEKNDLDLLVPKKLLKYQFK